MPLSYSLSRYVVSADDVAGSTDLRSESDPALRGHRLATEYGIRAFLGAPVRDEHHHPAGSLILFDTVPRSWTGQDTATLLELARLLRDNDDQEGRRDHPRAAEERADRNAGFLAALLDSLSVGVLACDPAVRSCCSTARCGRSTACGPTARSRRLSRADRRPAVQPRPAADALGPDTADARPARRTRPHRHRHGRARQAGADLRRDRSADHGARRRRAGCGRGLRTRSPRCAGPNSSGTATGTSNRPSPAPSRSPTWRRRCCGRW